jgi:hypothetical protein
MITLLLHLLRLLLCLPLIRPIGSRRSAGGIRDGARPPQGTSTILPSFGGCTLRGSGASLANDKCVRVPCSALVLVTAYRAGWHSRRFDVCRLKPRNGGRTSALAPKAPRRWPRVFPLVLVPLVAYARSPSTSEGRPTDQRVPTWPDRFRGVTPSARFGNSSSSSAHSLTAMPAWLCISASASQRAEPPRWRWPTNPALVGSAASATHAGARSSSRRCWPCRVGRALAD